MYAGFLNYGLMHSGFSFDHLLCQDATHHLSLGCHSAVTRLSLTSISLFACSLNTRVYSSTALLSLGCHSAVTHLSPGCHSAVTHLNQFIRVLPEHQGVLLHRSLVTRLSLGRHSSAVNHPSSVTHLNQFIRVLPEHQGVLLDRSLVARLRRFDEHQQRNVGLEERIAHVVHHRFTQLRQSSSGTNRIRERQPHVTITQKKVQ